MHILDQINPLTLIVAIWV